MAERVRGRGRTVSHEYVDVRAVHQLVVEPWYAYPSFAHEVAIRKRDREVPLIATKSPTFRNPLTVMSNCGEFPGEDVERFLRQP
jgi:hypothetical protein